MGQETPPACMPVDPQSPSELQTLPWLRALLGLQGKSRSPEDPGLLPGWGGTLPLLSGFRDPSTTEPSHLCTALGLSLAGHPVSGAYTPAGAPQCKHPGTF